MVQVLLMFTVMSHSRFYERLHVQGQWGNFTPYALYELVSQAARSRLNFLLK